MEAGAVLVPFAFALYFASRVDLGPHLYPVACLLALLAGAAGWIGHRQRAALLGTGAAAGCTGVVGVWLTQHTLTPALAWEVVGIAVFLSLIFHGFVEWVEMSIRRKVDFCGLSASSLISRQQRLVPRSSEELTDAKPDLRRG